MILLLLLSIFLHQAFSTPVNQPVSFSFSSFNNESCRNGSLICMDSVTAYDGYLSLTSEPSPSLPLRKTGRVLYHQPVLAWPAMISTTFTVKIKPYSISLGSADGLTFIFAPDNRSSPLNSYGEYLGIANTTTGCNISQLAVELDTYKNSFDIDGNHIGIDTTSPISIAAKSLNSANINLQSGKLIKVQIDYDGWTKMLYVSVAYSGYPLQRFLEKPLILSETVPSSVYVGFTAATGAISGSHRVIDWSFTTMPLPYHSLKNRKLINKP
ncbi:Lectin receptor kinase [Melia azedarach]|uniref:Lectin receptor kinase n=1 Tax=Melia azedarach TaxID=155640 RepID=A0ACC1XNK7_MELAZ|nr:Lectin receptor kinase [Melia azedarach]